MKYRFFIKTIYFENNDQIVDINPENIYDAPKLLEEFLIDNRYLKNHHEIACCVLNDDSVRFETCLPDGAVFKFELLD